ncbi:acetyl-CoA carboxylase biotin carboxylase subunit family protein [Mesorhizobium sp.]|uniref:ATP-grasp domain-containing protein n=1 Tax=Mesorhizobium sp. TaxID=1871066 RepID=UPI000FE75867|nr:acetyl-CoA carboxylase biotin carboxylase subunit family protein [Mesorhizobium sp.]RWK73195.1 MAG: ATP-grasp domain-containing protein [Mesorhizobium sp.]RWM34459.1 MAG: ATP-grasp domain-containing protein [Mesorhizobium sp.]
MARRALILVEGNIKYTTGNGLLYIQEAQRRGLHAITLAADPAQYSYLDAEGAEAIAVDTGNLDALIRECYRLGATHDIAGITSVNESVYATVGELCRFFELPGPNPASIERCCDKFIQRELLAKAGVPIPAYRLATNATEVERAAGEIGVPVVLKPAVGIGSSGVRLCHNIDELAEHTNHLLGGKHPSSPRILVEEFAQGPHYWSEIMGDEVIGIGTAEFGPPPYFVYREFTFPAPLTDEEYRRMADVSLSSLRALGLGWGPTNIELRWTKRGPVVIEVNPRLSGKLGIRVVEGASGIDLVREHIKLVIGDEGNLHRTRSQTAVARLLLSDRDGTLDRIDGDGLAAAVPGVVEVKFLVEPKTPIIRKGDCRDIIGYLIAASPTLAQTKAILEQAAHLIDWSIIPSRLAEQGRSANP